MPQYTKPIILFLFLEDKNPLKRLKIYTQGKGLLMLYKL